MSVNGLGGNTPISRPNTPANPWTSQAQKVNSSATNRTGGSGKTARTYTPEQAHNALVHHFSAKNINRGQVKSPAAQAADAKFKATGRTTPEDVHASLTDYFAPVKSKL